MFKHFVHWESVVSGGRRLALKIADVRVIDEGRKSRFIRRWGWQFWWWWKESLLIWDGCCIDDDGDDRDLDDDVPAVSLGVVWHDHGWCGHLHRSSVLMFPQPPKANICGRLGWLNVEKMQWAGQRREGVKDPNIKAQKKLHMLCLSRNPFLWRHKKSIELLSVMVATFRGLLFLF